MMREVVIVSAVRTPVGKFLGALSYLSAVELGAIVVREAVRRAGIAPETIDECLMGCVLPAGLGRILRGKLLCVQDLATLSARSRSTWFAAAG